MAEDKITGIEKLAQGKAKEKSKALPSKPFEEIHPTHVEKPAKAEATEKVNKGDSLLEEVRALNQRTEHAIHSSPKELGMQVEDIVAEIDTLRNTLETPNLEIRSSIREILKNKLSHIDENLKIALEKAGLEYIPPEKPSGLTTPIERFLGLLTHGQHQLETLAKDVHSFSMGEREISPANMILIQIKVSTIQQEIELFTSMLNKALESTKAMLNVQV